MPRLFVTAFACALLLAVSACGTLVRRAGERFAGNLGAAVLAADDPATVRDALPAYLLLLDALIEGDPGNVGALLAAAELNGAYAGNFVADDPLRAQRMATKALALARRAACLRDRSLCTAMDGPIDAFAQIVASRRVKSVPMLYGLAAAWAGYIQMHRDDWKAIAELPKVEALLRRVVALDPGHARGLPWVYLGVLDSLRPPAAGGQPERARAAFERAIALSQGHNLYASALMAETYARLVFDRELHDALVQQVLAADPHAEGYTLLNVLAQARAEQLRDSADDYF